MEGHENHLDLDTTPPAEPTHGDPYDGVEQLDFRQVTPDFEAGDD